MSYGLIFDVGMHTGKDTAFYLEKGFDVVAIEANPKLVADARVRFDGPISAKRLVIYEAAIADYDGEIDLYLNDQKDDWSTISRDFALRNQKLGADSTVVRVPCTTFRTILDKHEVPHYIKVDIEGADMLCLEALAGCERRPKYLSLEAGLASFDQTFSELALLWRCGYRQFKVVNQAGNKKVRCPNPAREGDFIDYRFDGECSGPFGEEAPGQWMSVEQTLKQFRRILTEQKYFGGLGKFHRSSLHRIYEAITREKVGWYDIHAKLGAG